MLRKGIHLLSATFAAVAAVGIVILMGVTVVDVVRREISGQGIDGSIEFAPLLLVAAVALGLGYSEMTGTHVRTSMVIDRVGARTRAVLQVLGLIVALVMLLWIAELSFDRALTAIDTDEVTAGFSRHSTGWARMLIPIGFLVWALEIAVRLYDAVAALRRRRDPPTVPSSDAAATAAPGADL